MPSYKSKMPLAEAKALAECLASDMLKAGFRRVEVCGSVRRGEAEVGDLDLVADGDLSLLNLLSAEWKSGGEANATVLYQGVQVNVWRSTAESWGAALFAFTGPKNYAIGYRMKAKRAGMLLNEKGLFKGTKRVAGETETGIYEALGKTYKEPAERGAR